MKKTRKNKFSYFWDSLSIQLSAMLIIALGMCGLHIGNDMVSWSRICLSSGDILQIGRFVLVLIYSIISILLFLLLVVRSRIMAYIVLPFVLITWLIPAYIRITMGHILYSEMITGALETNWNEMSGFLSFPVVCLAIVMLFLCFASGFFMRHYFGRLQQMSNTIVWSISIVYLGGGMLTVTWLAEKKPEILLPLLYKYPQKWENLEEKKLRIDDMLTGMKNEYRPEYPYRVLMPFYRQVACLYYIINHYYVRDFEDSANLPSQLISDDDVIVVLIIGESFRAQNASWNGYSRETLPKLSNCMNNIINFPYFKSYATSTISSIYGILSDANCQNRKANYTSFLSFTAKHNFKNNLLLCRTTRWDYNPSIHKLLNGQLEGIEECENTKDITVTINKIIQQQGRHFILLEDGTGHAPYEHEPQFSLFGDNDRDRYDNCLLQTDDMLFQITEVLKNKKAVVLYSSDHGQSFGENGCFMHGGPLSIVSQRHIFSFVWYSDLYKSAHPELINNIQKNSKKLLSHDDIYLSILSLSRIEVNLPTPYNGDFTKPLNRPDVTKFSLNED